ncbi:MAG: hypothetical protein M1118_09670 [Chloroflexi bacterium]|nr:hypothetical protein [Chloroflexota bacterium]
MQDPQEQPAQPTSTRRAWFGRAMVILFVLLLVGAIVIPYRLATQAHIRSHPATPAAFEQAIAGESLTVDLEITAINPSGIITGQLLKHTSNGDYQTTTNTVRVQQGEGAKLVLGSRTQLRPGAAIQASGVFMTDHTILATQLLVLPGNIKVIAG